MDLILLRGESDGHHRFAQLAESVTWQDSATEAAMTGPGTPFGALLEDVAQPLTTGSHAVGTIEASEFYATVNARIAAALNLSVVPMLTVGDVKLRMCGDPDVASGDILVSGSCLRPEIGGSFTPVSPASGYAIVYELLATCLVLGSVNIVVADD